MGEAIGEMPPAAVGVAISPFPIIASVLLLGTHGHVTPGVRGRPRPRDPAVGAIVPVVAAGASASEDGAPATWAPDPDDRRGDRDRPDAKLSGDAIGRLS